MFIITIISGFFYGKVQGARRGLSAVRMVFVAPME
jgi:hypothetical protein